MKERPILFSGPMVRAILEGRKTQTRRIIPDQSIISLREDGTPGKVQPRCPYGKPGDKLWVRETFRMFDSSIECACYDDCRCASFHGKPIYKADGNLESKWKPSIYMPRWASRIDLEITNIRAERLHDISEEDAKAEGIEESEPGMWKSYNKRAGWESVNCPVTSYRSLWESINGVGSWDENQFVWVIEFRRVNP